MPKEEIAYSCSVCGTTYTSKEKAKKCEERGKLLKENELTCVPWHWYKLTCDSFKNGEIKDIFVYKVNHNYDCVSDNRKDTCLKCIIELYNYSSNDYYCVPGQWQVVEMLSPMEMYLKYGKIFDPYFHSGISGRVNMDRNGMPDNVAKEINETFKLFRENKIKELLEVYDNDPVKLADYITRLETPQLNITYP